MQTVANTSPFLGVFVNSIYPQVEGVDSVLDRLQDAGVTAIATSPYVATVEEDSRNGERFPDLHVDGHRRVLSRPLMGRRELFLNKRSTLRDFGDLFSDQPYSVASSSCDEIDFEIPAKLITEAQCRGMEAHLQVSPFLVPKPRKEDLPCYPDGSAPEGVRVAETGCPNSEAVRAYGLSLVKAALSQYNSIDGLFVDWTEYGVYALEDNFLSFSEHSSDRADRLGYDWEAIARDVGASWCQLHDMEDCDLDGMDFLFSNPSALVGALVRNHGWAEFLSFKADSIVTYYREIKQILDRLRRSRRIKLSARGWPPPWNLSSGMDYGQLASVCDSVTPKFFSFDYCALPTWYADTLLSWNPGLEESRTLDSLIKWMDLPDHCEPRQRSKYYIPGPDERHQADFECYQRRLVEVASQVSGSTRLVPYTHAYMPDRQWQEMVELVHESDVQGMWIQMYGYLSDEKLRILKDCRKTRLVC